MDVEITTYGYAYIYHNRVKKASQKYLYRY